MIETTEFIPISKPSITELEIANVTEAVRSTWVSSLGKFIDEFEQDFATFCNTKYAIAVSNGTVAIQLALSAIGIKHGDEVIVPDFTFIASANAVLHVGAIPVFADIEKDTLCIDPEDIISKITKRTKAILPVHVYGHPAEMNRINEIAKEHNLFVIEDAAEAHGAIYEGKLVGSLSDAACFSFYGNKNLTTGEGGMITTNDSKFAALCMHLRDQAMSKEKRYWHDAPGFNYRMTNLQAAIGCAQMSRVTELLNKRREIFKWYSEGLSEIQGSKLNTQRSNITHAYWMMCFEHKSFDEDSREEFMKYLKKHKIDSRPYFYPCSMMPYFEKANTTNAYAKYMQGINLPTFYDLKQSEVSYICKTINSYFK